MCLNKVIAGGSRQCLKKTQKHGLKCYDTPGFTPPVANSLPIRHLRACPGCVVVVYISNSGHLICTLSFHPITKMSFKINVVNLHHVLYIFFLNIYDRGCKYRLCRDPSLKILDFFQYGTIYKYPIQDNCLFALLWFIRGYFVLFHFLHPYLRMQSKSLYVFKTIKQGENTIFTW